MPLPVMTMTVLYSAKGGSGTTVTAASLALARARTNGSGDDERNVLLVDLAGDLPAVLGMPETDGDGVFEWMAAGCAVPTLSRLERVVAPGVSLISTGRVDTPLVDPRNRAMLLWAALADEAERRDVIVDAGTSPSGVALTVLAHTGVRLLVTRPCYVSLRRAVAFPCRPTGVALLNETDRSLDVADVEASLGVPVLTQLPVTAQIARMVDAGTLATRGAPRNLARELGHLPPVAPALAGSA